MKKLMIVVLSTLSLLSAPLLAADADSGKAKYAACVACHGNDGIGKMPTYPNLAGQKEAYTVKQLSAFKAGDRKDPVMNAMAKPLSEDDMANIAAYLATLGAPKKVAKVPCDDTPKS